MTQLEMTLKAQDLMTMAMPSTAGKQDGANDDYEDYFDRGVKMDKAQWYMAQVDLDPIESHGSLEMT